MAKKYGDRVQETTTTTGTGAFTLGGAVAGFQPFSAVLADQDTADYSAFAVDANGVPTGDWETGTGTYTASGDTFARTTVSASSSGNNAVNFVSATTRVMLGLTSASLIALIAAAGSGGGGGGGITDAPADGNLYVRKNNAWAALRANAPMYRVRNDAATGGGYFSLAEIAFYSGTPSTLIPRGAPLSSGDYSGDYGKNNAVDGDVTTNWISSSGSGTGQYIGYASTDSTVPDPTSVKLTASKNSGEGNRMTTAFTVQGCYDGQGAAWSDLWHVTGLAAFADGEVRTIQKPAS